MAFVSESTQRLALGKAAAPLPLSIVLASPLPARRMQDGKWPGGRRRKPTRRTHQGVVGGRAIRRSQDDWLSWLGAVEVETREHQEAPGQRRVASSGPWGDPTGHWRTKHAMGVWQRHGRFGRAETLETRGCHEARGLQWTVDGRSWIMERRRDGVWPAALDARRAAVVGCGFPSAKTRVEIVSRAGPFACRGHAHAGLTSAAPQHPSAHLHAEVYGCIQDCCAAAWSKENLIDCKTFKE